MRIDNNEFWRARMIRLDAYEFGKLLNRGWVLTRGVLEVYRRLMGLGWRASQEHVPALPGRHSHDHGCFPDLVLCLTGGTYGDRWMTATH